MAISVEEFQKRLENISEYNGHAFGRAYSIFNAEDSHSEKSMQYKGYLTLSDAFKCFFLESIENLNISFTKVSSTPSESYFIFIPKFIYNFKTLCGSEKLAIKGYPYQACTLLRNIFDNLVLQSAALQNITDFISIEGIEKGQNFDVNNNRKLRKKAEYEIRKKMTGRDSGLSQETRDELLKINMLYDFEVHGGRMSLSEIKNWPESRKPLHVLPHFNETAFAMFRNRYVEISWMLTRLLPNVQPIDSQFNEDWKYKWKILDDSFEIMEEQMTKQGGKKIGKAFIEFVKIKFPFDQNSSFPL